MRVLTLLLIFICTSTGAPPFLDNEYHYIRAMSHKYNVSPLYVLSVGIVESQLTHTNESGEVRISRAGAVGILQVTQKYAPRKNKTNLYNVTNERENIEAGVRMLEGLIKY